MILRGWLRALTNRSHHNPLVLITKWPISVSYTLCTMTTINLIQYGLLIDSSNRTKKREFPVYLGSNLITVASVKKRVSMVGYVEYESGTLDSIMFFPAAIHFLVGIGTCVFCESSAPYDHHVFAIPQVFKVSMYRNETSTKSENKRFQTLTSCF